MKEFKVYRKMLKIHVKILSIFNLFPNFPFVISSFHCLCCSLRVADYESDITLFFRYRTSSEEKIQPIGEFLQNILKNVNN